MLYQETQRPQKVLLRWLSEYVGAKRFLQDDINISGNSDERSSRLGIPAIGFLKQM